MLPVSTAPNAIVFGAAEGRISSWEMIRHQKSTSIEAEKRIMFAILDLRNTSLMGFSLNMAFL